MMDIELLLITSCVNFCLFMLGWTLGALHGTHRQSKHPRQIRKFWREGL